MPSKLAALGQVGIGGAEAVRRLRLFRQGALDYSSLRDDDLCQTTCEVACQATCETACQGEAPRYSLEELLKGPDLVRPVHAFPTEGGPTRPADAQKFVKPRARRREPRVRPARSAARGRREDRMDWRFVLGVGLSLWLAGWQAGLVDRGALVAVLAARQILGALGW